MICQPKAGPPLAEKNFPKVRRFLINIALGIDNL